MTELKLDGRSNSNRETRLSLQDMITDADIIKEINTEWNAVEEMLLTARYSWTEVDVGIGDFELTRDLAIVASNLCVIFAIAVLEKTLFQMKNERVFDSKGNSLNDLMEGSKGYLAWKNYEEITKIRHNRNAIAHENTKFQEDDCLNMILAIREELEAWNVIKLTKDRILESRVILEVSDKAGAKYSIAIGYPPFFGDAEGARLIEQTLSEAKLPLNWTSPNEISSELSELADNTLEAAGLKGKVKYVIEVSPL